jgi:hypothetical protein
MIVWMRFISKYDAELGVIKLYGISFILMYYTGCAYAGYEMRGDEQR